MTTNIDISISRQDAYTFQSALLVAIANLRMIPEEKMLYIHSHTESPHQLKKMYMRVQKILDDVQELDE